MSNSVPSEVYQSDALINKAYYDEAFIEAGGIEYEVPKEANSVKEEQYKVEAHCLIDQLQQEQEREGYKLRYIISLKNKRYFTILLAALASIGGMLLGLDMSTISGANLYMPQDIHLTSKQDSLVVSGAPLGAVFGAFIMPFTNELVGRKWAIIVACLFYTAGAILEAAAGDYGVMISGRLLVGAGVGLADGSVPCYVAECCPKSWRGRLNSLYQFNIALGEVFGYVVNAIFVDVSGNWRFMLGSSLLWSTILLLGMLGLPESPRWLMEKGKKVQSFVVWKHLRGFETDDSKLEFLFLERVISEERERSRHSKLIWLDFVRRPRCFKALVVGIAIEIFVQFSGTNGLVYYMSTLMEETGFTPEHAVYMSLVGGGALLLGTIYALFIVDRMGRRMVAIPNMIIIFLGVIWVGFSFLTPKANVKTMQGAYISGIIFYELGMGPFSVLSWVTPAEVFPTYLRSYGMMACDGAVFLFAWIITYNFTRMRNAMTSTGLFTGFYGGVALVGVIFCIIYFPETKGKTLEEIDELFQKGWSEIGRQNIKGIVKSCKDWMSSRKGSQRD
ncbi:hypothetical protein GpartN1_g3751.t1 [Galdieria partita]|uniref:Major facilitator superfamily (MFS) profile domain-containing protein n=1 Tax=Galdieria partita TaxID=83374 RepID=A0A9C7PX03_9RHOD|nr:hypothetical protein GpartN1_g3751.t1 [Galdieria partita]